MDLSEIIRDFAGTPLRNPNGEDATYRGIILQALATPIAEKTPEQHFKIHDLGIRIAKSDDVELTAEDKSLIFECLSKMESISPLVLGGLKQIFDAQ